MDKVKVGIIGVGNMGSGHIGFVKNIPEAELVAICDIDKAKADAKAPKPAARPIIRRMSFLRRKRSIW